MLLGFGINRTLTLGLRDRIFWISWGSRVSQFGIGYELNCRYLGSQGYSLGFRVFGFRLWGGLGVLRL